MDLTSLWPSWGSQGSKPADGKDVDAGDNPKADEWDYLWFHIKDTFSSVETWVTNVENDVQQNSNDISTLDSGKADDPHGNEDHNKTFAVDGDAQPPETHDNTAHSDNYAVDGDTQPPEDHGNEAHSETFLTSGDVDSGVTDVNDATGSVDFYHSDLFGVNSDDHHSRYSDSEATSAVNSLISNAASTIGGLDNTVASKADDPHGNEAHSETFLTSGDVDSGVTDVNDATGSVDLYHGDLYGVGSSDHHSRYSDSEAWSAVETEIVDNNGLATDNVTVDNLYAYEYNHRGTSWHTAVPSGDWIVFDSGVAKFTVNSAGVIDPQNGIDLGGTIIEGISDPITTNNNNDLFIDTRSSITATTTGIGVNEFHSFTWADNHTHTDQLYLESGLELQNGSVNWSVTSPTNTLDIEPNNQASKVFSLSSGGNLDISGSLNENASL